jgi:hypothetical protein
MNSRLYIYGFILTVAAIFVTSCDDDLNTIGSEIQPEDDGIAIFTDTLPVSAETILMGDIYARTTSAVLGKYEDPLFGAIKSEYMFEFKGADGLVFGNIEIAKDSSHIFQIDIDSVQISVTFIDFVGDSLAPMGVAAYELTSPLKRDFYTNVNPANYCNMSKPLGQRTYTINDTKRYVSSSTGESFRTLAIDVDTLIGRRFVNEYLRTYASSKFADFCTFSNTDSLRKFFPGIYMASTFGSGSLINVNISSFDIYYTYTYTLSTADPLTGAARVDTTAQSVFRLLVTPEVIQLNSVQNSFPTPNPLLNDDDAVYMKTPAGVCVQLQLPLHKIAHKMDSVNTGKLSVNAGKLILKGYSEKESAFKYDFGRPSAVLLIEKDSLNDFFMNPLKRRPDGKTSFYAAWSSSTNSYSFTGLSSLITTYREKMKNGLDHDPYFVLIPVEADLVSSSVGVSIRQIYNYMKPSTAAIRRDPKKDLRFSYIYSVY